MIRKNHLYQLTFLPRVFPVSCYLIEEEHELTLIDAALPYSTNAILNHEKMIGKPITRIVLTHAHDDHVGSLDSLKNILSEAKVYISEREALILKGDKTILPHESPLPIRGGVPKKVRTIPDVYLKDGDIIGSLQALSTPGHTPGSMSFIDTRDQSIIAGDAFQTRGGIAVSGQMRWPFPFPALATWDPVVALQSAYKILDTNPSLIAVGHGKMILNPNQALTEAIAQAEQNLKMKKKVI